MIKHPGIYLKENYVDPEKISQTNLAVRLGVAQSRVQKILSGERSITPDMAIRLGAYYKTTTAAEWLYFQCDYDLAVLRGSGKAGQIESQIRC